jgi:hypothetical protein
MKQIEEEKEYLRKGSQPKIVVMNEPSQNNNMVFNDNPLLKNPDKVMINTTSKVPSNQN